MYIESFFDFLILFSQKRQIHDILAITKTIEKIHDNKNDKNIMTFDIDWRQTSSNDAYYHFEIVYFDRHLKKYIS